MAYKGTGAPKFGLDQTNYTMPHPIKGGRTETYEIIQDIYENIKNTLIPTKKIFRWIAEYDFQNIPSATLTQLMLAHNRHTTIGWAPHADYDKLNFKVVIDEFDIYHVNGLIDIDGLRLKLRAIETISFIPNLDTMIRAQHFPLIAIV